MSKEIQNKLAASGLVPVVVLEDANDALPTAKALLAGGLCVMEITFRTACAAEAISLVAENCPEMTVGAGTVVTLEQCKKAVACGAKFIVCPGFDAEVVAWCVKNDIAVTPGCVTPSEIMAAMKLGLDVVKFFPAGVYGGLDAMKALSGPFGAVKFIPTGGVNAKNCGEIIAAPFIHAVGGSWVCAKADIAAHNFDKITALCKEARAKMLGYELGHMGINQDSREQSIATCARFKDAFGFETKVGNSSNFAGAGIEVMNTQFLGEKGHIAILTNSVPLAMSDLEGKGFNFKTETAKYKNGRLTAIYLEESIGGFAVHLVQR